MSKVKIYRVAIKGIGTCVFEDGPSIYDDIMEHVKNLEVGDSMRVFVEEMDSPKFEKLPEFTGF